ncbi:MULTISPECIES: NADH-quinone oxidoreductase subunit L [unclassified Thioalkalivibrio]|uniref:NADH-quinone oxidoreductase subunit 5 family protein n=1 Tax=unclassified Thioalkalivibrio TaxID=2621013 RepID=UPI0003810100|nr:MULTISPECIES: proton-conducting transporter membrane subunit [unclassified Thioalkalivibrio]
MIETQWLIPLLPFLSALLVHLFGARLGKRVARLSVGINLLVVLVAAFQLIAYIARDTGPQWTVMAGGWGSLQIDPLSAIMALVVAGISLVVHIYSIRYMIEEPGYARFFMLLDLMTGSILLMVMAGDLITLLVAWHLIGVFLYFLLAHNTEPVNAQRYAFWTFITYRLGDLPLVLAAMVLFQAYGALDFPTLFARIEAAPDARTFLDLPVAGTVAFLVALAAFAKSAQFPLHTWLPYSMEGPTPVSALMHAGIVNAGGIIINRFAPVFVHSSEVLHLLFIVGLFTAVLGSMLMLAQNDIKKSLGYSTVGQMGFMIMETGAGAFALAIFHLIAHGLFKGTLFLGAGKVIGAARKHDGVPNDPLYDFLVERKSAPARLPWLLIGAAMLIVPLVILVLAHYWVAPDFFQKQGAIVLLFFGWITGVQVLFATHRLDTGNPLRMMALIVLSFAVIVVGYSFVGHSFESFLYPDAEFREALYTAAGIDQITFGVLIALLALVMVAGWMGAYLTHVRRQRVDREHGRTWLTLYSLFSREFYVAELYTRMTVSLLAGSRRLNLWLRWG